MVGHKITIEKACNPFNRSNINTQMNGTPGREPLITNYWLPFRCTIQLLISNWAYQTLYGVHKGS